MTRKKILCFLLPILMALSPGVSIAATKESKPVAKYTGIVQQNVTIRSEMSLESEGVGSYKQGDRAYILGYEPGWLLVVDGNEDSWVTGYVLRHTVFDIESIVDDILPYGATPGVYSAVLAQDALLYNAPSDEGEVIQTLTKGTKIAILAIENGWAKTIHWRQYAYFYVDAAEDLTPVYDVETSASGDTIAAFSSFFSQNTKGLNPNRILNIEKACEYISITLAPEEEFSFNGIAGPYRKNRGYLEAPAFVGGQTVASNGGGTCQVSSTLYNTLLPLKNQSITIVYRVAHGAGGASYLPHGVDAACGRNPDIDLIFRNDFDFPVTIEASAQDGVLYIALLKA